MNKKFRLILRLAAVYNLLWGAWVVLFPLQFFDILAMPAPNYPFLWQGMGMVIGVYGLGYYWASHNYVLHWPIVMVGFLGKFFGPLGFAFHALFMDMPWPQFGYLCVFNDLPWWPPFLLMLREAYKAHGFRP